MSPARPNEMERSRASRLDLVRARMVEQHVECLLLSLGADLPWLSGYEAMPLERPTVLVLPADASATLLVPELEAPRVTEHPELFTLRPWGETESPVRIVGDLVGSRRALGVSDRMWASLLLALQVELPGASFRPASQVTGAVRAVKDEAEVAALRAAGAAADRVAQALLAGEIGLIGRSERDVSEDISRRLLDEGHDRVNFSIVASGPNVASPHHTSGDRRIKPGEPVVCDFGGSLRLGDEVGYCSDITRTVVTGEPTSELRELYDVLEAAQAASVAAVAPGVACEEIDRTGRGGIEAAGYGAAFIHRIGHGIGVEEHEDPYLVEGNTALLAVGNACSVEPGIYLEGRMGARIEDIVVVTPGGVLACNEADHDLHVVEV